MVHQSAAMRLTSCQVSFTSASSRADRACLERAANPLHRPGIDSKLFRNDAHTGPPRSRKGLTDSFFECGGNWGPPEALSFTSGPRKPGTDSFCNHRPFEFSKHAQHLKHRLAGGCRSVEALLAQEQVDLQRVQLGQEGDQILKAAAQPVDRPGHEHVELPSGSVSAQLVERWALVASPSAAYAMIFVNLDDLTAHAVRSLAQLALLIG